MEILVGILSTLVTVLIGWQIYNVIALERRVDQKVKARIDEFTEEYKKEQTLLSRCNSISHRITLIRLLGIIELLAYDTKNSVLIGRCIVLYINDIVNANDKQAAGDILKEIKYAIQRHHEIKPFLKSTLDDIEKALKEFCKVDDVGFECLELLKQLRQGSLID